MLQFPVVDSEQGDWVINNALEILHNRIKVQGPVMLQPHLVHDFIKLKTGNLEHEVFGVMLLDVTGAYIAHEVMFRGSLRETNIPMREIIKYSLKHNACMMIIFHNHPGGTLTPSSGDHKFTRVLQKVLKYVDVQLVDHIIIAGNKSLSFAEAGIMPTPKDED